MAPSICWEFCSQIRHAGEFFFIIHCFCESQVSFIFYFYLEFLTSSQTFYSSPKANGLFPATVPSALPLTLLQLLWPPCSPHTLQTHPTSDLCACSLDLEQFSPWCHVVWSLGLCSCVASVTPSSTALSEVASFFSLFCFVPVI